MGNDQQDFGKGFLRGLKKVLFTDGDQAEARDTRPEAGSKASAADSIAPGANDTSSRNTVSDRGRTPSSHSSPSPAFSAHPDAAAAEASASMIGKVYQLLESKNQSGIDFLEVWKAAREMGGANAVNIRAAYTSLRIADPQLTRERLLQSADSYVQQLQQIIQAEGSRRKEEKIHLEKQREDTRHRLDNRSRKLEAEIIALQEQLRKVNDERQRVDENFAPRIADIDTKIQGGQQAVDHVVTEIKTVVELIQTEIN